MLSAVCIKACTSFGKQEPPYPAPAYRKWYPILGSEPIPCRTISISAPSISARFAISFMKLILVANIQLAAYLVNSALRTSITMIFSWLRLKGAYSSRITSSLFGLQVPITMRSGRMQSATAEPSLRNSGLETTSKIKSLRPRWARISATRALTLSAVPTGTVDLSMMIW
ncbi:hypothetical protein D3C85_1255520 [compost metagenome]